MMDSDMTQLTAALRQAGATRPGTAAAMLDDLAARYREPHRAYHSMAHVESCLAWLDWFRGQAQRPAEVELALWFHDAVYDPTRHDNEAASAALATRWLGRSGLPGASVERVTRLIACTRDHTVTDPDTALLVSIDLAILGAPAAQYARYRAQVRAEYAHVPAPAYRIGRTAVLQRFLQRRRLFPHPPIAAELEVRARVNLQQELAALQSAVAAGPHPLRR